MKRKTIKQKLDELKQFHKNRFIVEVHPFRYYPEIAYYCNVRKEDKQGNPLTYFLNKEDPRAIHTEAETEATVYFLKAAYPGRFFKRIKIG